MDDFLAVGSKRGQGSKEAYELLSGACGVGGPALLNQYSAMSIFPLLSNCRAVPTPATRCVATLSSKLSTSPRLLRVQTVLRPGCRYPVLIVNGQIVGVDFLSIRFIQVSGNTTSSSIFNRRT